MRPSQYHYIKRIWTRKTARRKKHSFTFNLITFLMEILFESHGQKINQEISTPVLNINNQLSIYDIQRTYKLGFNHASKIADVLCEENYIKKTEDLYTFNVTAEPFLISQKIENCIKTNKIL